MHPKLQQAIVATRSGRKKDAQHLLIDTLRDNPDDADAWYLLSQLVESENRQVSYLKKTVDIDPTHPKAKQRLMQLGAIPVPAPIFSESREPVTNVAENEIVISQKATSQEEETAQENKKLEVESEPVAPQPTRINKQKSRSENAKVDTEWRRTAGQPVTEKTEKAAQPAKDPQPVKTPDKQPDTPQTKAKQIPWLTILLIIILIGILASFGYWLYVFFFSSF